MKLTVQLISLFRAMCAFIFIIYHPALPSIHCTLILLGAVISDIADGFISRKYKVTSIGGGLLDLFSDKYLNCILVIFLIVENYQIIPLILIITKEIFILSFRSLTIDGQTILPTDKFWGGSMTFLLFLIVIFHLNNILSPYIDIFILNLGILNFIYIFYKIIKNLDKFDQIFKTK